LIGFLAIYIKVGAVAILSQKPWIVRKEFTMFGVGLFLHNVFLIILLTGVYFIYVKKEKLRKLFLVLFNIISVILYAATLQRYQIMLSIFALIILMYYTTKKINIRTVFVTSLVLISFFFFVSSFRLGELVLMIMYRIAEMKFSPTYAIFTEPYMYIAMNLENFAHAIEKNKDFSFGYYTFDFITAISGIKHWLKDYYHLVENPHLITVHFNTYSAFWTYYRDFGILGLFIIPFSGGLLISNLYYSLISNPTIKKISLYGMFLYVVIFSFFNSAFGFLWFIYNLAAIFLIFNYVMSTDISVSKSKNFFLVK
jgi:oligosaccharide repeat unit polymerase